ncbi:helicase 2 [Macrobrachium rosenbergii nudivirus]|nr:helicase 2 [Macrobrachium rosenbergii nudivirus]
MNPISDLIKKIEPFDNIDYDIIHEVLTWIPISILKNMRSDCIKEFIVAKITNKIPNLNLKYIHTINDSECEEYLNMYKKAGNLIIPTFKTLKNTPKSHLVLQLLNAAQRNIIFSIMEDLSCSFGISGEIENPKLIIIDAPSGTGKSFLIDCISLCVEDVNLVIVAKTKILLNAISTVNVANVNTFTTCKFLMTTFGLTYNEAISIFKNLNSEKLVRECIDRLLNSRIVWSFNLLIVDEYSLESPILLIVLCLIAALEKVNVIFMGDIKQQNTLSPSPLHNLTNFELFGEVEKKVYRLDEQMRIKDDKLLKTINMIRQFINENPAIGGNVKSNFHLKYLIFQENYKTFFKIGNYLKDIYLTDKHKSIKDRWIALQDYVKMKKITHVNEPFKITNSITLETKELILDPKGKFISNIPLVVGMYYLYRKKIVELVEICANCIKIKALNSQEIQSITKSVWCKKSHSCVDENYNWLESHYDSTEYFITQYPLQIPYITYYYVQGLTFHDVNVSYNLDIDNANSLYVGFSRITKLEQISAIETEDKMNLLYTMYKHDDYYYKMPKVPVGILAELLKYYKDRNYKFDDSSLKFIEVDEFKFERKSKNLKMLKCKKNKYFKTKENVNININKKRTRDTTELIDIFVNYLDGYKNKCDEFN